MPVCPETPPCEAARYGACLMTWAVYWLCLTGVSPMFAYVTSLDETGIEWALLAGLGISGLATGIRAALTHDDPFRPGSFVWSVGVIGLTGYILLNDWRTPVGLVHDSLNDHMCRAFFLGWFASNAVNIWLQLRGTFFRRRDRAAGDGQIRTIPDSSRRLHRRRRVTTEWQEEIEGHGIEALHHALLMGNSSVHLPPRVSPDLIEHDGTAPQIVYVKRGNAFIPVQLHDADDADAVPVNRRLR